MPKPLKQHICIYLWIDTNSINNNFNPYDPAGLDKRQLGQGFKNFPDTSVANAGRYTSIDFNVFCYDSGFLRFMVDPLVKILQRHFQIQKELKEIEFSLFSFISSCFNLKL